MNRSEAQYTSLTAATEKQQTEQPASLPQRYADWISYAVAVVQQAAPTAADFTPKQA